MADAVPPTPTPEPSPRRWSVPTLRELPKLTQLTLASLIGGGGGTGGGGSTVFGILLALVTLTGCFADRTFTPGEGNFPRALATIPCNADVSARTVTCSRPLTAPGEEIFGSQGSIVALTSANVSYSTVDSNFTFFAFLQNLSTQSLGWDGMDPKGVRVFFQSPPVATSTSSGPGTITIEEDSIGDFTATGQSYYLMSAGTILPSNSSGPVPWTFKIDPGVLTFSFSVLVAAEVPDAGGILRWKGVAGRTTSRTNAVAFTSNNDMMAVGNKGVALRWNGTQWNPLTPPMPVNFNAVAPIGDGNYIVAADEGRVFRTRGNLWTQLWQETNGNGLLALWVKDSLNWVAVGKQGAIVVSSGGTITEGPAGTLYDLVAVTARSNMTAIAALDGGNSLYLSDGDVNLVFDTWFDGISGDVLYDQNGDLLRTFGGFGGWGILLRNADTLAVWGSDAMPRYLVQLAGDRVAVAVYEFATQFTSISSVDYSSLPAVGSGITDQLGYEIRDFALAKADESQFIATQVGWNEDLFRWSGAAWLVDQPTQAGAKDIWGVGDTAWVVEGTGGISRIVNGVATNLPFLSGAKRIWGLSSTDLYVADDTALWQGNGTDPWILETVFTSTTSIQDVWGDPASGALIVVAQDGAQGVYQARVGGLWGGNFFPALFTSVWGCSGTQAWLGTQDGMVWVWDGTNVGPDIAYLTAGFPPHDLTAMTGSSCFDAWATGSTRTTHWDGTAWSTITFGVNVPVLAMREPGRAYLLSGTANNDYLVDTTALQQMQLWVPAQERMMRAAWQLDNGELLVGGDRYILRGVR
jgi:hypothetical protein